MSNTIRLSDSDISMYHVFMFIIDHEHIQPFKTRGEHNASESVYLNI